MKNKLLILPFIILLMNSCVEHHNDGGNKDGSASDTSINAAVPSDDSHKIFKNDTAKSSKKDSLGADTMH
jgi:hypothetical protein